MLHNIRVFLYVVHVVVAHHINIYSQLSSVSLYIHSALWPFIDTLSICKCQLSSRLIDVLIATYKCCWFMFMLDLCVVYISVIRVINSLVHGHHIGI